LSPTYVDACFTPCNVPDHRGLNCQWYGLQWWIGKYKEMSFSSARGMRGQYIIMIPDEELIIVRLGHHQSKERVENMPPDMFVYIDAAIAITGKN